ncbi:Cof-type HAD-IIB family hydrolase [Bacillus aquiflavi]|uniref:Cof-type HAD-IIB family hydrolase n=1 Tax=Bacillus aquiflavi TaxID=2672567 RepID=UPI001CA899E3|nr:Cof-type HAD-IIB family hydrolase [Bacillus aquiflavi]UAC47983.1 Cof-type HAD-IIB family hydrolase [Bacillus aquiflavi]
MIKCIAIDMDGTLLSSSQEISEENKCAIEQAQANGVEVVIATGRSYEEAKFLLDKSNLICPIICLNGAEVRTEEGEIVLSNPLTKEQAIKVAKTLHDHDVYFEVFTNKGAFTNDEEKGIAIIVDIFLSANPNVDVDIIVKGAEEGFQKGFIQKVDDYQFIFNDHSYVMNKLLGFSFEGNQLAKAQKQLKELKGIAVTSSGQENIEITNEVAQKGIALEAFTKERGITLQETMAIGDHYNDLSMFKRVGRSVAMGNASNIIKAQCDFVTTTNEENGVAKAILDI